MCDNSELQGTTASSHNGFVRPLLTDYYLFTMAYAYWKSGKNETAVFEMFIRKNPFHGEFTIFAGLEECLNFVANFRFSDSDIAYLKETLPAGTEPEFFDFLRGLTANEVSIDAPPEGSVLFPKVPMMRVEGPLIVAQLMETTLLTLVNYASLMATNAARYRIAAGKNITLLEFGLRRAQGPDGGLSASRYAYMGGFDGTSNVLAGKLFHIPTRGTHGHAYITSFYDLGEVKNRLLAHHETGEPHDLLQLSVDWRLKLSESVLRVPAAEASDGELAAWITYAAAFPTGFMALVDTYDVRKSGLLNFCAVAMALHELGYRAVGVRIDSGDLAYLSNICRRVFGAIAEKYEVPWFADLVIVASNNINEETIVSLNEQGHSINCFGVGTHLVTCQRQPALGAVYKMVEIQGRPCIKLSEDFPKTTMPGKKNVYRLYGTDGHALVDLLQRSVEAPPCIGEKVLCRHPFQEAKRAHVIPSRVKPLLEPCWSKGALVAPLPSLEKVRAHVEASLKSVRNDHKRNLNPTPYKVSVSADLYSFIHKLWLQNAPIGELL
ncbi:nicotinate phosphoribosyltransferase [Bacillus rossius redtenbacheri]|uniref:nicotinate phosphoribosyltransferase n=1 Tax=Bacillus rossius redtenbacheri TaxID=93214 RepID=UPI002FDE26A7